jgi:hypothetical protein
VSQRPQYRFTYLAGLSACALLTSFCSSTAERRRVPTACEFAPAQTLGPIVNSAKEEGSPTVSADEGIVLHLRPQRP